MSFVLAQPSPAPNDGPAADVPAGSAPIRRFTDPHLLAVREEPLDRLAALAAIALRATGATILLGDADGTPTRGNFARLVTPLISSTGSLLGRLYVTDQPARQWSRQDQRILTELTTTVSAELELRLRLAGQATARLEHERALRLAARRLQLLMEHASVLVTLFDRDGTILHASAAQERALGVHHSGLTGEHVFARIHPDDRSSADEALATAIASPGQPVVIQLRQRREDGDWKVLSATITNRLDDPAVGGMVLNAQDVTELTRLETQLRQAQKMEAVGRLAGGVAHDFNNLLTVIEAHGQFALETLPPDAEEREDLAAIRQATARASGLTRQLLAFSRRQMLQPCRLDLNEALENVGGILRRLIAEDVELTIDLSHAPCHVYADPGQLEQVFMNLVVNARDAMPHGGTLRVATAHRCVGATAAQQRPGLRPGRYVALTVADNGTGIDPMVQTHVFEPFFTTKAPGRGTGLGLATVYGVVKQSGGYIYVESTPGLGSVFTVLLPSIEASPMPEVEVADEEPLPRGNETVLLAEDEAAVRAVARRALMQQGFRVLEAANGIEAERLWQESAGTISILVTDAVMPERGGRELTGRLRAMNPQLRVLVMSGYDRDADGSGHGPGSDEEGSFTGVIQKPFAPDALVRMVREILDRPPRMVPGHHD